MFTGILSASDYSTSLYALALDHGLTIAFTLVALKSFIKKETGKSTQVSTLILAISYLASSVNFYFFNFLIDEGFMDFSLYLSYTFLDSLTVLCVMFAHAFYRIKFSFSSNVICYMVLISSHFQFFISTVIHMYAKDYIQEPDTYYALGGIYSMGINTACWIGAAILTAPIKTQALINKIKLIIQRKEIAL